MSEGLRATRFAVEVREAAVGLAVAATRTMLVDNLDRARGDALIDTAIGEVRRKLH